MNKLLLTPKADGGIIEKARGKFYLTVNRRFLTQKEMDLHLKNQVVLVTGGSTGLGRAISTMLAAEGARVAINYVVNPDVAQTLAKELTAKYGAEALAVYADVSREDDVLSMFEEVEKTLGPIDALVNNAAYVDNYKCIDLTLDEFKKCVDVNLQGMFLCSREIIRRLVARGAPGRIVNVASQAAVRGSMHGKTAYDMTKAGLCETRLRSTKPARRYSGFSSFYVW